MISAAPLQDTGPGAMVARAIDAVKVYGSGHTEPPAQHRGLRRLLGLVYAMLGFAVVIALMGIANTLSLSIHERTRELGLLRAVGMTPGQLRSSVRRESVIIAVFGTLGGIAIAVFFAWIALPPTRSSSRSRFPRTA